jgi:hypothetical protein
MKTLEFFQRIATFFLLLCSFYFVVLALGLSAGTWKNLVNFEYGLIFLVMSYLTIKVARYPFETPLNKNKFWVW